MLLCFVRKNSWSWSNADKEKKRVKKRYGRGVIQEERKDMYEYQTDESEELKILKRNILQPSLSNYLTLNTDHRTGREVTGYIYTRPRSGLDVRQTVDNKDNVFQTVDNIQIINNRYKGRGQGRKKKSRYAKKKGPRDVVLDKFGWFYKVIVDIHWYNHVMTTIKCKFKKNGTTWSDGEIEMRTGDLELTFSHCISQKIFALKMHVNYTDKKG